MVQPASGRVAQDFTRTCTHSRSQNSTLPSISCSPIFMPRAFGFQATSVQRMSSASVTSSPRQKTHFTICVWTSNAELRDCWLILAEGSANENCRDHFPERRQRKNDEGGAGYPLIHESAK